MPHLIDDLLNQSTGPIPKPFHPTQLVFASELSAEQITPTTLKSSNKTTDKRNYRSFFMTLSPSFQPFGFDLVGQVLHISPKGVQLLLLV